MLNKLRKTTTSGFQKTVNKKNRHHPLQVSEPITENREYPEGGHERVPKNVEYPEGGVAGGPHLPLADGQAGSGPASSVVGVQWNITGWLYSKGAMRGGKKGSVLACHIMTRIMKSRLVQSRQHTVLPVFQSLFS